MAGYEYRAGYVDEWPIERLEGTLQKFDDEGWEVVSIFGTRGLSGATLYIAVIRRPKADEVRGGTQENP